ncbi:TPA: antirestriction protein [Klebsiella pneumoniae]|nr:antirestriction protein [Klebsiella pneumoniae]
MYHARQTMLNVEESDRLSFLPDLFGNDFLAGEMQVYAIAVKHITDYCGGFWHFIRIPEGGGYMMPDGDRFHLTNPDNWFDRSVSADAAGVIITALAINRRIWLHHERGDAALTRHLMLRESQLWDFIDSHDECAAIYAALD